MATATDDARDVKGLPPCGTTHYAGCDCREADWAARLAAAEARCAELERERDALSISCSNAVSARDAADARRAEAERERDEWKGNAAMQSVMAGDRARERDEALANAARYEEALKTMADDACHLTGQGGCKEYGQLWPSGYCYPCIARAALAGQEVGR